MSGRVERGLHLLALSGLAILQPLLDLLADEPELLAAHGTGPAGLVLLVGAVGLVPPALLWSGERLAGAISPRLEQRLHLLWVWLLCALVLEPIAFRLAGLPDTVALATAALLAAVAARALGRVAALRAFLSLMALAPLVFAAIFLTRPSVAPLLATSANARAAAAPVRSQIPVVLVVLDELPLASLLDEHGGIDAHRYPAFARLSSESTWFRDATTVDWRTPQSLAALLTGRYPGPNRTLPVHAEHPENLFSLLDGAYEMHVVEDHTRLAPWRDAARLAGGARRVDAIAADLAVVYAHVVTPPGYARDLPALDQRRHGFGLQGDLGLEGEKDRAGAFRRFVSEIEGPASPALHFLHVLLPHTPWRYLPSGNTYHPFVRLGRRSGHTWPRDEWWVVEAWQRHLLQVRFVDRLLGELLERLDATGLYEPALVIVVADHGMAFWPGESARDFAMTSHPEDVLSVPLFVKRPGQREGAVSSRNVETVDVLPLVVHALGADPGWPFDGCSPFDPACPERADKVAFTEGDSRDENRAVRFPAGVSEQSAAVAKRLDVFGSSRDGDWLYRFGPYAGLVGREAEALVADPAPAGHVVLEAPDPPVWVPDHEEPVPVRVTGLLESALQDPSLYIAVAWAGRVRTVVPVADDRSGRRVAAMLPESALGDDPRPETELRLYRVAGPPEAPRLRPLTWTIAK